jgi:Fe-S-cluster formation regulator IscX/YfhJ
MLKLRMKIILNLILPLEAFDDEPEEGGENYFTEEILREGVKLALIDMEKYFKN